MTASITDEQYMRHALLLAKRGMGWVSPNPMVGAVLVKNSKILGEGYHQRYGALHAERNALANCTSSPHGATLYVTLEPCCHYGKTPPCTEAILAAGIARVVVGSSDPNPLVAGKGVQFLRQHGIAVTEHVLQPECDALNRVFFHYIQTKRPYVVLKYAMTMDGKIATAKGLSKWITGEEARHRVQESRHQYRAILVGVNTVCADDPLLTCRLPNSRTPIRIVCDTHLRTPQASQIVQTAATVPTILVTCCAEEVQQAPYRQAGCHILVLPEQDRHPSLSALMDILGAHGIDSVLLEGGSTLHWSALQSGIVQKVEAYLAPTLFGGAKALSPIGGVGVDTPTQGIRLSFPQITRLGNDLLLESEVLSCSPELLKTSVKS